MPDVFTTHNLTITSHHGSDADRALLSEVSVSLPDRGITLLTGINGSGKTLLMRSLIGLQPVTNGRCLYRGQEVSSVLGTVRREVGFLFQNPLHQLVERTVLDDIILGLRYQGFPAVDAVRSVQPIIERLSLEHLLTRDPYTLSTGEQRRTVIAGLLAGGAHALLLDEPFTGLDYPGACELIHLLTRLKDDGHAVVVCTHDLVKIFHHADHCIVLESGSTRFEGSPGALAQLQRNDPHGLHLEPTGRSGVYP